MLNGQIAGVGAVAISAGDRAIEKLRRAITEGSLLSLEDLGHLVAENDGRQRTGGDPAPNLSGFRAFAVGFCDSVYSVLGIADERTRQDLRRVLTEQPLLDWRDAVLAAADVAHRAEKEKERERLVPLGVRLAETHRGEPMEFLELLLQAYAASLLMTPSHRA